jgi:hypothetical protein
MIRAFVAACFLLLMACATQDSRWSAFNSDNRNFKNTGQIEYNGIGGSGRQQSDPLPENGLGGSGNTQNINLHQAQANGLGGSGRQAPDILENGLGGSGKHLLDKKSSNKAAILGPISAFGSIWVNDRHIQLPDSTEYLIAGKGAKRSDLRLGQMVAVLADSLDDSDYQALEVHLLFNVIGPLNAIEKDKGQLTKLSLLGQTVLIDNDTRIVNQSGTTITLQQLNTGEHVAISGLRMPNQEIKATLVIAKTQQNIQLAGPVSVINGQYWLGQQQLAFTQQPEFDQPLRMHGDIRNGVFIVNDWAPLPHHRIFELADEVWLEGFPLSDAEFFIEGFEVQLPEFTDDLFDPNDSMRIGIDLEEQEFWMDHEPPEDDMQWQQDDVFMRSENDSEIPEFEDDFDGSDFEDSNFEENDFDDYDFEDSDFDDADYDQPYYDDSDFDDQDYYPQE